MNLMNVSLMLNPSAWSKTFWTRSMYFECVQIFLTLIKCEILLHKLACLNMFKKILMHSKNIEQDQKHFERAERLSINVTLNVTCNMTLNVALNVTLRPTIRLIIRPSGLLLVHKAFSLGHQAISAVILSYLWSLVPWSCDHTHYM